MDIHEGLTFEVNHLLADDSLEMSSIFSDQS